MPPAVAPATAPTVAPTGPPTAPPTMAPPTAPPAVPPWAIAMVDIESADATSAPVTSILFKLASFLLSKEGERRGQSLVPRRLPVFAGVKKHPAVPRGAKCCGILNYPDGGNQPVPRRSMRILNDLDKSDESASGRWPERPHRGCCACVDSGFSADRACPSLVLGPSKHRRMLFLVTVRQ